MPCPGNDTIAELACRRVRGGGGDALDAHLADCGACRQVVAALAIATLPRILASGSAATVPVPELAAASAANVLLGGARVDRYVIDRLLGAGGMGLVYSARDPELDRPVALKLLHPSLDADPTAARRQLVAEGQAMARLRHPNVTVVYDVGDHGAQVFIAMELVDGETLRAYVARLHGRREIVRALIAAGRGLAAAHAVGLVHRDFKPENVLVGRDGRICVSDFGLARAVGASDGAIAGTPAYMAPEQLAGADPDPRADQYSFAVTAYEALVGHRPDRSRAVLPRSVRRAVERGLALDPATRHASMDAFVAELERALGTRKRMLAVGGGVIATAGIATLALILGTHNESDANPCATAATLPDATWSSERGDALRTTFAATHAPSADAAAAAVVHQLDHWASSWAAARHDACTAARVRGVESQELLDLRMTCLDRAAQRVGLFVDALAQPSAQDVAQALDATERTTDLTVCTGARALLEVWRAPPDPAARAEADTLRSQLAKAQIDGDLARYPRSAAEATAVADRAAAHGLRGVEAEAARIVADAKLASGNPEAARAAFDRAVVASEAVDHARLRVLSYCGLARVEGISGNVEAADRLVRQARAIVDRLGDAALNIDVLDAEARLAYHHHDGVRAAELAHKTVAASRALHGDDGRTGALLEFEGVALDQIGKATDARARFEEELAIRERIAGRDSPTLVTVLSLLGADARAAGKLDESIAILTRASTIVAASKLTTPAAIGIDAQLASTYSQAGKPREALAMIERVIPRLREHMPDALNLQANLVTMRGEIEDDAGDSKAALTDYAAGRALLDKRGGVSGPDHATIFEDEGLALRHLERWAEAKTAYESALVIRTRIGGAESPDLADCEAGLGEIALAQKDPTTAIAHLERALKLRSGPDADPANVAHIREQLERARAAKRGR